MTLIHWVNLGGAALVGWGVGGYMPWGAIPHPSDLTCIILGLLITIGSWPFYLPQQERHDND